MFRFGKDVRLYSRTLLRLLYPAFCVVCRVPLLLDETYLCTVCQQKIQAIPKPACLKCARRLPPFATNRSICGRCRSKTFHYDRGFVLVRYESPANEILHQVKYGGKPWLLSLFIKQLHRFPNAPDLNHYEVMVPIPIDPKRERERGFNQALLIARMLKKVHPNRIPVKSLLKKQKRTMPQSRLRRFARLHNLRGAFSARKRHLIRGKRILLVDDVFTTGSTVNECAKTLKAEGAKRVDFLAIARSLTP